MPRLGVFPSPVVTLALILCIFIGDSASSAQQSERRSAPEPLARCAETLRFLAIQIESNYQKLRTIKGRYEVSDRITLAPQTIRLISDAQKSLPAAAHGIIDAENVRAWSHVWSSCDFAVDLTNNRLWTTFEPSAPPLIVDESGRLLSAPQIAQGSIQVILNHDEFLDFYPNINIAPSPKFPSLTGRAARRDVVQNGLRRDWSDVIDIRKFYLNGAGAPIWQYLTTFAKQLESSDAAEWDRRMRTVECEQVREPRPGIRFRFAGVSGHGSEIVAWNEYFFYEEDGFNLSRITLANPDKQLIQDRHTKYTAIDGILIPGKVWLRSFGKSDSDIVFERTLRLADAAVNVPIPDSVFTVANFGLRDGERFLDNIDGILYVKMGAEFVAAESITPPPRSGFYVWLVIFNVLAVCALLLVAALRRRVAGRRAPNAAPSDRNEHNQ